MTANEEGICDVTAIVFRQPQILDAAKLMNKC